MFFVAPIDSGARRPIVGRFILQDGADVGPEMKTDTTNSMSRKPCTTPTTFIDRAINEMLAIFPDGDKRSVAITIFRSWPSCSGGAITPNFAHRQLT